MRTVRRSSGKRLIKNSQQSARYSHHACSMSAWQVAPGNGGRDWFLVPFFPDHLLPKPSVPREGKQTEQESSFLERTILQITLNGGEVSEKQNHDLQNRLQQDLANVVV